MLKTLLKEMKDGLNKWKALLSWIRKLNIVKVFILPKATDRFDVTLVKNPNGLFFFSEVEKTTFKFIWNCKNPE